MGERATCETCRWWTQKAVTGYCRVEHKHTWHEHSCSWWTPGEHQPREVENG